MPDPKEWITVKEAAFLADRDVRQIYRWIDNGLLATRKTTRGVTQVLSKAVQRIETEVKRGRPKGSASRR
ncbi:hypothetical protein MRBLWO14_000970 [Microbacterium sp. LWO14-1.2]|uniref:hypothetical protein n=1 Tax=Microbacterium sp. LWO14-1.2 TaxID=3135263 RepID=UPI00313930B3